MLLETVVALCRVCMPGGVARGSAKAGRLSSFICVHRGRFLGAWHDEVAVAEHQGGADALHQRGHDAPAQQTSGVRRRGSSTDLNLTAAKPAMHSCCAGFLGLACQSCQSCCVGLMWLSECSVQCLQVQQMHD